MEPVCFGTGTYVLFVILSFLFCLITAVSEPLVESLDAWERIFDYLFNYLGIFSFTRWHRLFTKYVINRCLYISSKVTYNELRVERCVYSREESVNCT